MITMEQRSNHSLTTFLIILLSQVHSIDSTIATLTLFVKLIELVFLLKTLFLPFYFDCLLSYHQHFWVRNDFGSEFQCLLEALVYTVK